MVTILMGAYSFITYSFLETFSVLIENKPYHIIKKKPGNVTSKSDSKHAYKFAMACNFSKTVFCKKKQ
ncbi:hypothetical protein ATE84_0055 [Aquimarina sp. MAR_2010_214]|nr:hypothetical protein ATE84_0055 [Aquimarina sp. MAR_2010_214]